MEAEVREILASVVTPQQRVRLGDALASLGREIGLTGKDLATIERLRDQTPVEPLRVE